MTQREKILKYMKDFGSITAYEAVIDLGITQLAARLCELKANGYEFNKEMMTGKNRYGSSVWVWTTCPRWILPEERCIPFPASIATDRPTLPAWAIPTIRFSTKGMHM